MGITLSIKKFKISKEVAFAGYVVKQGAIRPSPERAIALKEFPRPQNIHELRSFLGLAQQFAGFIPDLAHASEPLPHLLKKEHKYTWTIYLQEAFDAVVKILTCNLVLINFDPSKPTILLTEALRLKGLGFALVHTKVVNGKEGIRLVTCGSRSLNPAEKSYAVVELEALAINYAVEKCRYYLLGMQKFTVWTNHRPLLGIWRKQIDEIGNARCQNLSFYNFNVEWKAGKTHYIADRLSRAPYWDPPEVDSVFCFAINPTQGIHDILQEAAEEEDYKRIIEAVSNGVSTKAIADCHPAAALRSEWDYLSVINGLVVHDCKRIVIPRGARDATLQVLHRSHAGVAKTAEAAKQLYFWPKMNEHIKNMIDACERCQFYKSSKQKQEQIQQTPFKDLYPLAEVGADLFEAGKHHFLIVVDRYSGFLFVARLNSMTAESIIGPMEKMFFLLGRPGKIKCDNGPCFRTEFKNWAKERDIVLNNSAPNKPTSNGLAERAVGIVKHMLLKHHLNHKAFMHALMEFRSTPQTDSYLPSQVFYGRRMKTDTPITAAALRTRTDLSAAESARQRVSDSKRTQQTCKARRGHT
jgi:hypothetical protein